MRSVFTTFASSRFVDREAVVEALRNLALCLKAQYAEVVAIYLFGSFATGRATPHSDADVVVEVGSSTDAASRERLLEAAQAAFLEAPAPVDVFVFTSENMRRRQGVAGAVAREGVRLA